jgi:hypothetical protein
VLVRLAHSVSMTTVCQWAANDRQVIARQVIAPPQ